MFNKVIHSIRGIHAKERIPVLTLFADEASPPVRFVQMTAAELDVPVEIHNIDLFKGENRTEFYREINPLMKVPALMVDDHVIADSHAIALYLCENFGGQKLYPQNAIARAKVHQMMFFNSSILFPIDSAVFCDYFANKKPINEKRINDWHEALDFLDTQLGVHKWLVHDTVTLSDLCCGATVSSIQLLVPPIERHANINRWLKDLQKLPCFDINARGLERLRSFVFAV